MLEPMSQISSQPESFPLKHPADKNLGKVTKNLFRMDSKKLIKLGPKKSKDIISQLNKTPHGSPKERNKDNQLSTEKPSQFRLKSLHYAQETLPLKVVDNPDKNKKLQIPFDNEESLEKMGKDLIVKIFVSAPTDPYQTKLANVINKLITKFIKDTMKNNNRPTTQKTISFLNKLNEMANLISNNDIRTDLQTLIQLTIKIETKKIEKESPLDQLRSLAILTDLGRFSKEFQEIQTLLKDYKENPILEDAAYNTIYSKLLAINIEIQVITDITDPKLMNQIIGRLMSKLKSSQLALSTIKPESEEKPTINNESIQILLLGYLNGTEEIQPQIISYLEKLMKDPDNRKLVNTVIRDLYTKMRTQESIVSKLENLDFDTNPLFEAPIAAMQDLKTLLLELNRPLKSNFQTYKTKVDDLNKQLKSYTTADKEKDNDVEIKIPGLGTRYISYEKSKLITEADRVKGDKKATNSAEESTETGHLMINEENSKFHVKSNANSISTELQVGMLNHLLTGGGSPVSTYMTIMTQKGPRTILVMEHIDGDLANEKPEKASNIKNYEQIAFNTLITRPHDGSMQNFIIDDDQTLHQFDLELSFADPFDGFRNKKEELDPASIKAETRNALLFLPQKDNDLSPEFKRSLSSLDPDSICNLYLMMLDSCSLLLNPQISKDPKYLEDNISTKVKEEQIWIRPEGILKIHESLTKIQSFINLKVLSNEPVSINQLFKEISPSLHQYYSYISKISNDIQEQSYILSRDISTFNDNYEKYVRDNISPDLVVRSYNFLDSRTDTPLQSFEDLI